MKIEEKLKEALKKDFRGLYVKEFTTDWKAQRFVRELEIDVMTFEALEAFISTIRREAVEDFVNYIEDYFAEDFSYIRYEIEEYLVRKPQ